MRSMDLGKHTVVTDDPELGRTFHLKHETLHALLVITEADVEG